MKKYIVILIFSHLSCQNKVLKTETQPGSLIFISNEDLSAIKTVVLDVFNEKYKFDSLIKSDTFHVSPFCLPTDQGPEWWLNFNSEFKNLDTLTDFNYKLTLVEVKKNMFYSDLKLDTNYIYQGLDIHLGSFNLNGKKVKSSSLIIRFD